MKALAVLFIYVTPFVILGVLTKRFVQRQIEDVDISNVREQAGARHRKRRVSFWGSIRD